MLQKPWYQLAFSLGEAALSVISGGVLFIIISHASGPELLGTYALGVAWLMLFQGVSCFGIPEFLMREVGAYGREASDQVHHAMLLGLGSGCVALGLMLGSVRLVGYRANVVQVVTVGSLALIPAFLNSASRSVFLAVRKMHLAFLALLVEVTITLSASIYLLLTGHGAQALMASLVVAKVTSATVSLLLLYSRVLPLRMTFDLGYLRQTASTMIAFGIGNVLFMVTMRINIIMTSLFADIAAVGQFAAATKVMEMGLMMPSGFVQLLMTRIAHSFNTQGNRDPNCFSAWYQLLFDLVITTSVGVWVFAGLILQTLFGTSFGQARWILRILMIYLVIESADAIMSVILKASYRQGDDVSRLAFNPLTNIVLNLILLPILGTVGAAIGRVGGVSASATLRHRLISRELTRINWLRFGLKPALIGIGVGSVCYSLLSLGRPIYSVTAYVLLTVCLLRISSGFSSSAIKDMMSVAPSQE